MINPEREIGSILAKARFTSTKTIRDIAISIRVPQSNISSWETGNRLPSLHRAKEIARAYGLDEDVFSQMLEKALAEHKRLILVRKDANRKGKRKPDVVFSGEINPGWLNRIVNKKAGRYYE
jgi:transcriptional regulator with XRE-family HTH domain